MAKWIKNNSGSNSTYAIGQVIADTAYFEIPTLDEFLWANDSTLLSDIGSGAAIVAKDDSGNTDIADVNEAINYLKGNQPIKIDPTTSVNSYAFADKKTHEGKKLYGRTHGKSFTLSSGANTIDFDIPYAACKITGMEVVGSEIGDTLDFFILDDDSGTYSTVPNYVLNQFGFDVAVSKDFYKRESPYDADLYYDMCISIAYYSTSAKTIYVNYVLHEVKD